MTQSRSMSLVEAATNVVVGYALAVATQIAGVPMVRSAGELSAKTWRMGGIFTGISLLRSYALRRLFEQLAVVADRQ